LADELPRFGLELYAGDLVTMDVTTACSRPGGDLVEATFDGVGAVSVRFD